MRTLMLTSLVVAVALTVVALPAKAEDAPAADDLRSQIRDEIKAYHKDEGLMKVKWKSGLNFETADKKVKAKIGGRIFFDVVAIDDDDLENNPNNNLVGNSPSGTEFRRVRLYSSASIGKFVHYKVQFDFAGGNVGFRDVYVGIHNLRDCFGCGVPNVKVGHFFEPFSLEQNTSSKYITFMNRSAATLTFAPERSTGIMIYDSFRGGSLGYAAGVFANSTARFNNPSNGVGSSDFERDGLGYTGRLWWVPWKDCSCDCRRLHVGASYSHRRDLRAVHFRTRPGVHLFNRVLNTDYSTDSGQVPAGTAGTVPLLAIDIDTMDLFGAELAFVYGPWSIQGEYYSATVDSSRIADPTFSGWYAQASYWLTGECRNYEDGKASFGRVKPCCNFLDKDCCCWGAVEVGVRYSFLDLNDSAIQGGEMGVWTFGVNWHLNPNARIMLNYTMADIEIVGTPGILVDESISAVQTRFQVDF